MNRFSSRWQQLVTSFLFPRVAGALACDRIAPAREPSPFDFIAPYFDYSISQAPYSVTLQQIAT